MAETAAIRWEGDARQFLQTVDRMQARIGKLEKKLKDVKAAGKGAGEATGKGFGRAAREIGKIAAGLGLATGVAGGLRQALSLVLQELDQIRQKRLEAAAIVGSAAAQRAAALRNLPTGVSLTQFDALTKSVAGQKVGKQTFAIPLSQASAIVSQVLTTKGPLSFATAEQIALSAGREAFTNPLGDPGLFAGQVGDIIKASPKLRKLAQRDPQRAVVTAAGFGQQFQTAARGFDPALSGVALGKAISGGAQVGFTARESAALLATISQLSSDITVRRSGTGVVNLARLLFLRFSRKEGFEGIKTTKKGLAGLADIAEQISALPPDEQKRIIQKLPIRASVFGPVLGLLTKDPDVAAALKRSLETISPLGPKSIAQRKRILDASLSGELGAALELEQGLKGTISQQALADIDPVLAGIIQEKIPQQLRLAGQSKLAERFAKLKLVTTAGNVLPEAIEQVRGVREGLAGRPTDLADEPTARARGHPTAGADEPRDRAADANAAAAAALQNAAELMQSVLEKLNRLESSNANTEPGQPQAGGD